MKTILSLLVLIGSLKATAGLPDSPVSPGGDMTVKILHCVETQWNESLEVEITDGGLAGLTMARVSELIDGYVRFRKTFIVQNQGILKKEPPVHFYNGQGIRLEVEMLDDDPSPVGRMEVELEEGVRRVKMLCRYN